MSLLRTHPLRSLPRAATRLQARSTAAGAARFQRGYATEEEGKINMPDGKKPMPVAGIAVALTIPAMVWFFMGSSPKKKAAAGGGPGPGIPGNEERSRTVPAEQPMYKEQKMANPKAVAPDKSRLQSEKVEKSNTLTGVNK